MITKKILLAVCVLLTLSASAQEIKTKKDKILFEKKEIAQFEKKNKWYTISDLNGNKILKIKPNMNEINDNVREIYYEVSSPDDMVVVSVFNKSNKSPMSLEKKFLIDFTLGEYKLFTANGIDTEVAQVILGSNSDVKSDILKRTKAIDDEENRVKKLINSQGITFNDKVGENGEIMRNKLQIGHFVRKNEGSGVLYELYNHKNNLIGSWYSMQSNVKVAGELYPVLNNELVLVNHKKIAISGRKRSSDSRLSMDNLALIILGYALDNNLLE